MAAGASAPAAGAGQGADSGQGARELTVTLVTDDGIESQVSVAGGTSVLAGAETQGVYLPSMCGQGSCGACAARVVEGEYEQGDHDPAVLGAHASDDSVLLCVTYPQSDCRVELPYDRSRVVDSPPAVRTAEITALDQVGAGIYRVRLLLRDEQGGVSAVELDPGQFIQVQVPGSDDLRAYSVASCANWDGLIELFVRIQPEGRFSGYLTGSARVGDRLTVHGPRGAFGLRENGLRPRWFVAGGTGIAPVLSMLRRMAEWGEAQSARLFLGVNTPREVFGQEEIAELSAALPDFVGTICVWRGEVSDADAAPSIISGTPAQALAAALAEVTEMPDIYTCGPPLMVDAVEAAAREAGIPADQVFAERYTPS